MNRKTLKALRQSIGKWKKISSGRGYDQGCDNCALCNRFGWDCADYFDGDLGDDGYMEKCPIYEYTGVLDCATTPYEDFVMYATEREYGRLANNREAKKYAGKMHELLIEILHWYEKQRTRTNR